MKRWTAALIAGAALMGGTGASPPREVPETTEEDPFVLMIDAGRMLVFTDKIETALDIDREEGDPDDDTTAPALSDLQQAAASVRSAALAYLSLKVRACVENKFTEVSCTPSKLPAWLSEPANTPLNAEEIRRRSDDLYGEMGPLLNAACEYGKAKMEDDLFCSVE